MINKTVKFLSKHLTLILVVASYLFFTCYYMGPSIWHCSTTVYGFGDNTAGPIWRFGMHPPQSPLGSYEALTNYPAGENLYSPVNFSLSLQAVMLWGTSKIVGSVCSYNIINIVGFTASALVMFGFIYTVTRSKWIAWLAGFAVSFSPYYQMKVGGHPGYGYQALLIGAVWAFYNLLKKQRKRDAGYLAAITASCFYFDPYFSLLVIISIAPLAVVWLLLSVWYLKKEIISKKQLAKQVRLLLISAGLLIAFLLPIVGVSVLHGKEIASSVAAARGNVLFEARACSNLPHEYAVPFVLHSIYSKLLGKQQYPHLIDDLHSGFQCGIGEDTVGISLIILFIVFAGLIIFSWEALNKRRIKLSLGYDNKLLIFGLISIGLTAVVFALPPAKIAGIPMPSYALLMITTTWRTLTRLYVLVNFATVGLFAIFLAYAKSNFVEYKKWLRIGFCLVFLLILVDYQAFRPFTGNRLSTFNYAKDVPTVYQWLKTQDDIHEIAEYPLERAGSESNAMAYYLSMQSYHHKPLFNGAIPTSKDEEIKASLKDISDPQTKAVLYSEGIDAVVIHGLSVEDVQKIPDLEILHTSRQEGFNILSFTPLVKNDTVVVVKIVNQQKVSSMISFADGFVRNTNVIHSAADWEYESLNKSKMRIVSLPGRSSTKPVETKACFAVRMATDNDSADLSLLSPGHATKTYKITSNYTRVVIDSSDVIELVNSNGHNMRVKDLGCLGGEQ